jgi:LytS/YehU family sensor histidine kinase
MTATLQAPTRAIVSVESVALPVAVAGLAVISTIHGLEVSGKLDETFYIGVMYVLGPIATSALAGALLLTRFSWFGWALAGLISGSTFLGYCLSRTTGLPRANGDIGNWGEPAGVLSLIVEGLVFGLAVIALRRMPRPVR